MPSTQDHAFDYYRAKVSEETKAAFGSVGAVAANITVAQIVNPGASGGRGWYEVWGHAFHDADSGLKLDVGGVDKVTFASLANIVFYFGPFMVEITNDTSDITIETAAATTAKAAATVYAKRMADA